MIQQIKLFVLAIIATFVLITSFNYATIPNPPSADLDCGFTADFQNFLSKNGFFSSNLGYSKWGFDRTDLKCGAYGGKA